ncbi:MAG: type II secretion system F family protein [Gaiellaceae bacterium]
MILVALIALALIGFAIVMFFRAAAATRVRMAEHLGTIAAHGYGPTVAAAPGGTAPDVGSIDRFATSVGERFGPKLSFMREDETQRRLIAAGYYTTPARRFIGYQLLATTALVVLALWIAIASGASVGAGLLVILLAVLIGWGAPHYHVSKRATRRLREIDEALPELIDLLAVTIEAGLAFGASLRLSAERLSGPLGDELRLTLQEQSLGLSPTESLDNWLQRTDTPAVRAFVRAMTQGERLGISVGQILRNLAIEMRKRRRATAEERAQKAPIKILFPLVFLIFPALFLILLGPAAYSIVQTFSGT